MRAAAIVLVLALTGACREETAPTPDGGAAGDVCARRVLTSDVTNARDLGGWPVATGVITCRRILRGGVLTGLTQAGCTELSGLGVRTLIDLREPAVQTAAPEPACATSSAEHVSAAMPKLLPDTPENYLALLNQGEAIRKVFSVFQQSGSYPVYLHCEIGRDRASFVTALILLAAGADRQTVMDEFILSEQAGVAVRAECMSAVLDEIDARGGIEAYLQSVGVPGGALDGLRQSVIKEAP